jgi:hypothetical protein
LGAHRRTTVANQRHHHLREFADRQILAPAKSEGFRDCNGETAFFARIASSSRCSKMALRGQIVDLIWLVMINAIDEARR